MHERINGGPGKRNNFPRICAKRTLVGSEANHGGMIQSIYPRQGQAASQVGIPFSDLLCKLSTSMTVSTSPTPR
jgi:hypothetical protein